MFIEAAIISVIIFFVMEYNGTISINKFINDNKSIFKGLKEEDFDFLVKARYGDGVDIDKLSYYQLKNYYKTHLAEIDSMLPYYLKSLEILIQHYTVPVALGKSLEEAPKIFQEGLKELLQKINAGDSSITPYMDFAKEYPVRDSMRMMRLLYRLGLGSNERKQEQLLQFSHSISSLQQKARETRYKNRLDKMEKKTMTMLVCTGVAVMILLLISIMNMF